MKRLILFMTLFLALSILFPNPISAKGSDVTTDSRELMVHDALMLFLLDPLDKAIGNYYSKMLLEIPTVYPYDIKMIDTKRVAGFRSFHFTFTLEVEPVIGPHISVGKDRLTFEISPLLPEQVKLTKYKHLKTYELPLNWKHLVKPYRD
ncbi:DUF3888 domain-containing protein [Alkalihalobacillus oceani]|uniref:DUF3888 domain-containing protein n=1 Tax=Halalkalibacter oceani TaxID=1653776 RepID=A0A9X2DQU7_9BACI|nr:DUF3888 domain-containing protein [Halalkalibacter oceani]MCM3714495.1 DUF3888 domain-containing protein [Halalkalibacter oceani]